MQICKREWKKMKMAKKAISVLLTLCLCVGMVWIHGGAFNFGASSQPEYDGANLARHGRLSCSTRPGL